MKKLIALCSLVLTVVTSTLLAQHLVGELIVNDFTDPLPYGTTNTVTVDGTASSTVRLQASFTGGGAHTTTAVIGVTNSANATNGQTITVTIGGTATVYTWTNNPVTSVTNLSSPYTNIVIGVTNSANATNGQTLAITINGNTNTFTWTNSAVAATDVATNSDTTNCAVNLYNALSSVYPPNIISRANNVITFTANVRDIVAVSQSAGWGTNQLAGIYSVTNVVATNSLQILSTNAAGWTATNLFNRLNADFPTLSVSQSGTLITLVTLLNPGLTVSETGAWATNLITTNAILGTVFFKGSNSLDRISWFRDSTKDFSVAYSTTTAVSILTNFPTGGGFLSWSIENSATNYAEAQKFKLRATQQRGF